MATTATLRWRPPVTLRSPTSAVRVGTFQSQRDRAPKLAILVTESETVAGVAEMEATGEIAERRVKNTR